MRRHINHYTKCIFRKLRSTQILLPTCKVNIKTMVILHYFMMKFSMHFVVMAAGLHYQMPGLIKLEKKCDILRLYIVGNQCRPSDIVRPYFTFCLIKAFYDRTCDRPIQAGQISNLKKIVYLTHLLMKPTRKQYRQRIKP